MTNRALPLGDKELANLKTMLRDSPLAGIAILEGSSRARLSIGIKEIAEVFASPHKAAHERAAQLLKAYYPGELSFYQSHRKTLTEEEGGEEAGDVIRKNLNNWPEFEFRSNLNYVMIC